MTAQTEPTRAVNPERPAQERNSRRRSARPPPSLPRSGPTERTGPNIAFFSAIQARAADCCPSSFLIRVSIPYTICSDHTFSPLTWDIMLPAVTPRNTARTKLHGGLLIRYRHALRCGRRLRAVAPALGCRTDLARPQPTSRHRHGDYLRKCRDMAPYRQHSAPQPQNRKA